MPAFVVSEVLGNEYNPDFNMLVCAPVGNLQEATHLLENLLPKMCDSLLSAAMILADWYTASEADTCRCENPECGNVQVSVLAGSQRLIVTYAAAL